MSTKKNNKGRAYLQLLVGALLIYGFIFLFVPWLLQSQTAQPMMEYIEEEGLDNSALFYTESPVTGQVEFYVKKHGLEKVKGN